MLAPSVPTRTLVAERLARLVTRGEVLGAILLSAPLGIGICRREQGKADKRERHPHRDADVRPR